MKRTERRIDNTDCTIFSAMPTEGILAIKTEPLKTVDEFTHAWHIQQARTDLGFPFPINSWFRTFIYNRTKKVGSNDGSQHPLGLATDIRLTKARRILFKAYWKLKGWGAVGLYWTFVPGDSRGFWKEWKG